MCVCWPTSSVRACGQCVRVSVWKSVRVCISKRPRPLPPHRPLARSVSPTLFERMPKAEFLSRSPTLYCAPAPLPLSQLITTILLPHHPAATYSPSSPSFRHIGAVRSDSFASPIVSCKCWDLDRAPGKQSRRYHPVRSNWSRCKHYNLHLTYRRQGSHHRHIAFRTIVESA